ncbi:hypothetical protein Kuja_0860 [Vibrio phage vB_VchM_Kuja]|uniref:Uncharacterized protein n=1 Tax=Vibrio phage vB_VchM_Kuja TaxID=2686437 RepID=A0A6B9JHS8_9CAUD|nr:hypothetical protein HWC83_gp150 [Vibrio phage vB_VchM_Kuja]QGZ16077.1 hypothetical protein Kuja_0860 [Vibrio phage vB_VchM_Kuja]
MDTNNDKAQDLIAALEWEKSLKREHTVDEVLKTEKDRCITIGFVDALCGHKTDIRNLLARIDEETRAISEMTRSGEVTTVLITNSRGSIKLEVNGSEPLVFIDEAEVPSNLETLRREARRLDRELLEKERKLWKRK